MPERPIGAPWKGDGSVRGTRVRISHSLPFYQVNIVMDDILFAKVDLPILDKKKSTDLIMNVDNKMWFWDKYRATNMLPLMTKNSEGGKDGASNYRPGQFNWLPYTPKPIVDWFEYKVFPWMGQRTRILALMTRPNFSNNEHIDCNKNEVGTRQHKFRIVLQGRTDTLYFKTTKGDVFVPNIEESFIMAGDWAHGMHNIDTNFKLTLAVGSPWTGHDEYDNIEILMRRSEHSMPEDLSSFF